MAFSFSNSSAEKVATCHRDLQLILNEAIRVSPVDFGVSEGHRSVERQFALYQQGRVFEGGKWVVVGPVVTNVDGINNKGKHNEVPSKAADIYAYVARNVQNMLYDKEHLAVVAGVLLATAARLRAEGKITHWLRWGADWDSDGEIATDHRFVDRPHFELI